MDKNKEFERNRSAENDIRDESADQPGVSTISNSNTDEANQHLTKTSEDSFRTEESDTNGADPSYEESKNQE